MENKVATLYSEIERVSRHFREMSSQQITEYYLLLSGARNTPYSEYPKYVKWFNEGFIALMGYNGPDRNNKMMQLAQEFLMKVNNAADKNIRRIYIGKNNEDAHPKRISPDDIGKFHKVYLAEKTEKSGLLFYKMKLDGKGSALMEAVDSIPGVSMKNDDVPTKVATPAPVSAPTPTATATAVPKTAEAPKSAPKPASSDFNSIFGGSKAAASQKKVFTLPHHVFLAIPSSFIAEKNGLPVVDSAGNILEGRILAEEIKDDVNRAKSLGAKWDNEEKLWFVPKNTPLDVFKEWMPDEVEKRIYGEMSAADLDFTKALIRRDLHAYGFDMAEEKICVDEGWQNVPLLGGDTTKKPGSYVAETHGDKITCMAKSFKGAKENKKFSYVIESRANGLNALVTQTKNFYAANLTGARLATSTLSGGTSNISLLEEYDENAKICQDIYEKAVPADSAHPYLLAKALGGMTYTLRSPAWKKKDQEMLVPFQDIDGKIWSLQNIPHDLERKKWIGLSKRKTSSGEFVKRRTRSKGCFYIVNKTPISVSSLPDTVLLSEGFATCATLNNVLNYPVVMAISKGNFEPVITEFLKKYPGTKFIIASDNDLGEDLAKPKPNHGLLAATAVQEKFGKDVVSIVECTLSNDELKQGWSDFNDVYSLGKDKGKAEVRIASAFRGTIPPQLSSTLESHASKAEDVVSTHP